MTGSKAGFFPDAGTIMLSWFWIISSNTDTASLTAGGGERSTETRGRYLKSFSPRVFRMSKNVFWAASFSAQRVLQRAVSLPNKSDICTKQRVNARKIHLSVYCLWTYSVTIKLQGVGEFVWYRNTGLWLQNLFNSNFKWPANSFKDPIYNKHQVSFCLSWFGL